MKALVSTLTLAALAIALPAAPTMAADEVNVYSSRKEELIKPLLERFTAATGIPVNLVTGKEDALTKLLMAEKVMIIPRAEGDLANGEAFYQ